MPVSRPRFGELIRRTDEFFGLHWCGPLRGVRRPAWSEARWALAGHMAQVNECGLYAFLNGAGNVLYIGSAIGAGGARYAGASFGQRMNQHFRRESRAGPAASARYVPRLGWSEPVAEVALCPMPREQWYLALALEAFLVSALSKSGRLDNAAFVRGPAVALGTSAPRARS